MSNPARHLAAAAESVRAFNDESADTGPDWEMPGDAYAALAHLAHIAHMLTQAIDQVTLPVVRTHKAGQLRIDNGQGVELQMAVMRQARSDARLATPSLADALNRLHASTGPMGSSA